MGADGSERAGATLAKVDHVAVMMLENRSFDHMLGYPSLTGRRLDIHGLRPEFANEYEEAATRFTASAPRPCRWIPTIPQPRSIPRSRAAT